MFVNLLDYSTGVVPVTTADKTIDVVDKDYIPLNEQDEILYKACEYMNVL